MRKTLLIVDDKITNREILKGILDREYDCLEAADGKEAIEVMTTHASTISVVLLDLIMPVMDGFEVLRAMRDDEDLKKIPVIVTTVRNEEDSEVKAFKMGANDYISKPYSPIVIMQRIQNVINLRETAAEVSELRLDPLTGLYNRSAFMEKAAERIMEKDPGYYIIGCFDINNFKIINDEYGTDIGDEVLRSIGTVFKKGFDDIDSICSRIMADEFAAMYPRELVDSDKIRKISKTAVMQSDVMEPLTFSIGRYIVDDLSLPVSAMYDRAVMAKKTVKGRFDTNIAQFNESMRDELIAEQKIISEMRGALDDDQFEPWFQPQYNHETGQLIGAEALVRWRHPERGILPPGVFVPVFEKKGFIYELDKYMWERTCACIRRWIDEGRNPLPVSVNISRYDIHRDDLIDNLSGLIKKYGIPYELLRLEVTESAFSMDNNKIGSIVRRLVDMGFTVEIDDFGSGYSSLNILKDVPAQIIKLDMKFLDVTDDSPRVGNILESIVRMAKWLGMNVIAEGVETKKQANFLKSIGCFYVQGYYYARPMPIEEYEALASGSVKQQRDIQIETVENFNNNAFWDPESTDTLIFNSYIGGACIYEYCNGQIELVRANDKYISVLGSAEMQMADIMKLDWTEYLDEESLERISNAVHDSAENGEEETTEVVFVGLPGCAERTYLLATMRVIAAVGSRYLMYCISENITEQRIAEHKMAETNQQLVLLDGIAHEILTQSNTDEGIRAILERLLGYFDGDRAYVLEFDNTGGIINDTFELCAENIPEERTNLQDIPLEQGTFYLEAFEERNYINIPDVEALDGTKGRERLLVQGVKSIIAVPLRQSGELIGVFGIDNPHKNAEHIKGLTALGDYIVALLNRGQLNAAIDDENKEKLIIMDGIPGGFVRMKMQLDGTIIPVYRSTGFRKLIGMDEAEVAKEYGNSVMRGVHPDDMEIVNKAVATMLECGEVNNVKYRLKAGGGGYVKVAIFGKIRKTHSGEIFFNVYYTDASLSEPRDETTRLREVLPIVLDTVMKSTNDLAFAKDRDLKYVCCSRNFMKLAGASDVDDVIGKTDYDLFDREIADKFRADDEKLLNSGRPLIDIIENIPTTDNMPRYARTSKYLLTDPSGNVLGLYGVGRDITEVQDISNWLKLATSNKSCGVMTYEFMNGEMKLLHFNEGFREIFGISRRECMSSVPREMIFREDIPKLRKQAENLIKNGDTVGCMFRLHLKNGGIKWIDSRANITKRYNGKIFINAMLTDVTERQNMIERLRLGEAGYRLVIRNMGSLICRFTIADRTMILTPETAKKSGLPQQIGNMPYGMLRRGFISDESRQAYIDFFSRIIHGEKSGNVVFQMKTKDGLKWMRADYSTVFSGGKPVFAVILHNDVTEQLEQGAIYRKWQQSLQSRPAEAYTLIRCNISQDTSVEIQEGKLLATDFTTLGETTFNERTIEYADAYVYEDYRKAYLNLMDSDSMLAGYYHGVMHSTLDYRETLPNGGTRWLRLTVELVRYPKSKDIEVYLMYENIDSKRREELRIKSQAETDPLTGALNRTAFEEKMTNKLGWGAEGTGQALMVLDLDDFKSVNDTYGHVAGDRALIEVAGKIRALLRQGDLVGRLGGDEFLVCMCDITNRRIIEKKAERIRAALRASDEFGTMLGASIGMALCPDDGKDFATLYQKADTALYHAKRNGKDKSEFYSNDMECEK